jgi:uncharacterized membrane protein YeaQ/YmgE (transglycosylase-associated protein family)
MLGFMWWLVIGLVAGVLARFLIPGRQPMTWFMTIVLGLLGSIVGGVVSSGVFGTDPADPGFHPSGLIMSTIGAAVLLGLYLAYSRRTTGGQGPMLQ